MTLIRLESVTAREQLLQALTLCGRKESVRREALDKDGGGRAILIRPVGGECIKGLTHCTTAGMARACHGAETVCVRGSVVGSNTNSSHSNFLPER